MLSIHKSENTEKNYKTMVTVINDFLKDEKDVIANLANISAIINSYVQNLNWVGFYILKKDELVLGPFQGMPACVRIKPNTGICMSCVSSKQIVNVPNVQEVPNHIACDSATKSELVAPIFKNGNIYGVLDLDSPMLNRFTKLEEKYILEISSLISEFLSNSLS